MYGYRKYRNVKTVVDGQTFDSKKEAKRYAELATLEKAGEIKGLLTQQKFLIVPKANKVNRARYYVADFVYTTKDGRRIIEDVKSPITKKNPVYSLKKALVLWQYPDYDFLET